MLAAARPRECSNTTSYNKIFVAEILAKKGHSPLANFVLRLRGAVGEVSAAPDRVGGGASMLTAREREIMLLAAEGLSNTKIARRLGISDNTVRVHLQHIYRKLRIRDRTTLAAMTVSSESRIIKLWRGGYVHEGPRMDAHKFFIGQHVQYKGTSAAPSGIYLVLARLPRSEHGEFQYRIKHSREPFQLSAKERELKATASSGF